jgi:hypothetical protein
MFRKRFALAIGFSASLALSALADTPRLVSFQAFLTEDHDANPATPEVPVDGVRNFRFSVWTDASSVALADRVWFEERNATVHEGQLQVLLGQAALAGGVASGPLDESVFAAPVRWIEIHDLGAAAPLSPRIRVTSAPYAMRIETLDGATGGTVSGNLEVDALKTGTLRLSSGAVAGHVLVSDANGNATWQAPAEGDGSATHANGSFHVKSSGNTGLALYANKSGLLQPDAAGKIELESGLGARVELSHVDDPSDLRAVLGGGTSTGGGSLNLYDNGSIGVYNDENNQVLEFISREGDNEQPMLKVSDSAGELAFRVRAASDLANDRPEISLLDAGKEWVQMVANKVNGGTTFILREETANGTSYDAIEMETNASEGGATIWLRDRDGNTTMILDADEDSDPGNSRLRMQQDGEDTIVLSASDGRVKTQILEITGGSDLSEQFDVNGGAEPGTVVSIDAANPGQLVVSSRAYDRTVAGIVSGAGGVETGMIMGQKGSIADGQHAIALTGRVYVKADASHGAIQPGDLLTTSERPGFAMRVDDHARATGAVLGKAMTALKSGEGLVLVLVGLQ